MLEGEQKTLTSGGNILGLQSVKISCLLLNFLRLGKLNNPNNLFQYFEAVWSKILPPDLKTSVYIFFAHPLLLS